VPNTPPVSPDAPLLHALARLAPARLVEHPDRCVVGVQQVAGHDLRGQEVAERRQRPHRAAAPIGHRRIGNVGAHPGEDLVSR
jgi:hypothetical protein